MTSGSPFDFDIRVSADKRRRGRGRRGFSGAVETSQRTCEHPDCDRPGQYRAPKSPDRLDDYWWFCLEHVREYNLRWNYFADKSPEEFERQMRADRLWERPTRPFSSAEQRAWARLGIHDPIELLGEKGTHRRAPLTGTGRRLSPTERRAISILGARETMSRSEIRKLYKSLVRDLHPDMNGGRRDDEERLQQVIWAWEQIRESRNFSD